MRARHLAAIPAAIAIFAAGVSLTTAAPAVPRLAGTTPVTITMTVSNGVPPAAGTISTKDWVFTPSCATGGCTTQLARPRITSDTVTDYDLVPNAAGSEFVGTIVYNSACTNAAHTPDAFVYTETIKLDVDAVDAGNDVTSFHGTLTIDGVGTPAGLAAGCLANVNAIATFIGALAPTVSPPTTTATTETTPAATAPVVTAAVPTTTPPVTTTAAPTVTISSVPAACKAYPASLLSACKAHLKATASCAKLGKGKRAACRLKADVAFKRVRALAKCSKLKGTSKTTCQARARAIGR
jgi:hypothetical protein